MAIDYPAFLNELRSTTDLARRALADIRPALIDEGLTVPGFAIDDFLQCRYASGKLFFERVWGELEKSLSAIERLSEATAKASHQESQVALDEIAFRQRKLFETFCAIVQLSNPAIYANGQPGPYFLHYHWQQEAEYLRLRNADLTDYFGGACNTTGAQRQQRQHNIDWMAREHHVDPALCTWRVNNARENFVMAFADANDLEKTALGFGYQQVFGAASSQVHMNMCGFYDPGVTEHHIIGRADSVLLLTVCTILRAIQIAEQSHGNVAGDSAAASLQREFRGAFPNQYASAAIGNGEEGDIVSVFEAPDIFVGHIATKRENGDFVSYEIEPLGQNVGRSGCFTDVETMVIVRRADLPAVIQECVDAGFITENVGSSGSLQALSVIIQSLQAFSQVLMPRMNAAIMPSLFFVQRYLEKAKRHERRRVHAYYRFVGRQRRHGHHLDDWLHAEAEIPV